MTPRLAAKADETHAAEIAAYAQADGLIAISDVEQAVLQNELPDANVFVIPNVHEIGPSGPGYANVMAYVCRQFLASAKR